ncbi:MAG: DUF1642 domain-containing protein [Streptococcus mitis]|nr:DUF1642 domain-containing protein [Streptococcus mitis]
MSWKMKLNELIKEFEEIGIYGLNMFGAVVKGIPTETAIDLIKQLDEPQPVKVPPFVADWYLLHYHDFNNSIVNLCIRREDSIDNNDFLKWISNTKNFIQILVNMHQFGYEVEEEKRYLVKIKATKHYIAKDGIGKIFFSLAYKESFTKKELEEAGFGWVFDCPGIEIEEVE